MLIKKVWYSFLIMTFAGAGFSSCANDNGGDDSLLALLALAAAAAPAPLEQYTPDQANWDSFASEPFEGGTNTAHDPDGVGWLSAASWENAKWDGTVYDPTTMSQAQFTSAICPSGDQIRGIREVFYQNNPFADNRNPTKAEVDEWHRIAINHVRALVGYTSADRQVQKDHCMFKRALWGQERKFTTMWDSEYPDGTCTASNPHCGASFIPDMDDQAPYLPAGHSGCSTQAGAEGVTSAPKTNIPWSIKWSRAFCQYLGAEGFWGGHVGPFFHREKFGFSFWDNGSNATLRAKWTGELKENRYPQP